MEAFITCSLTQNVMIDPVIVVSSGQTYERTAILEWFKKCKNKNKPINDPNTHQVINDTSIIENWAIRSLIDNQGYPLVYIEQEYQSSPNNLNKPNISHSVFIANDKKYYNKYVITNYITMPLTINAVIDISSSMNSPSSEQEGSSFYSRLTLVKIVLKVLVNMCLPSTKLGLITFSSSANVIFYPTFMTNENKKEAYEKIDNIVAYGSTYISTGITKGIELIENNPNRNNCIIILTDGEPSESISTIKKITDSTPEFITFYTISFGYGKLLNSTLMYEIASKSGGGYAYIPDSSCVAEVFVCLMATLLSVGSKNHQLKSFIPYYNAFESSLSLTRSPNLNNDEYGKVHIQLVQMLNTVYELANTMQIDKAIEKLVNFVELFKNSEDSRIKNLIGDLIHHNSEKGQVLKALKNWEKWGQHYLPAVLSAHTNCTQANLKDTSMQYYSNENIFHIIDNGIKYYESLPPPSADFKTTLEINSDTMRNISQTPCFGEGTILMLQNPLTKGYVHCKIENIKKNDILFGSATVLCVIKSKVGDHKVINIEDGVYITPYHPIVHLPDTQWTFPITRYENCIEVDTNVVYNLVLDKYHKVILGTHASIIACTLGHGIDKDIVAHSYLGTDKVINDLKKLDGWNSGNIIISGIRRDYYGLICEMY